MEGRLLAGPHGQEGPVEVEDSQDDERGIEEVDGLAKTEVDLAYPGSSHSMVEEEVLRREAGSCVQGVFESGHQYALCK